jgi:hypothetical protein
LFLSLLLVIFCLTPPHIVTLQGCFMGKRMENKEERDALIRRIMNIFDTSRPERRYLPLPSSLSPQPASPPHSPLPTTANKEEAQQTPPEPILHPVGLLSLVSPQEQAQPPAEEQTPLQIVQTTAVPAFTPRSDAQEQQPSSADLPVIQSALPNPPSLPQTIKVLPSSSPTTPLSLKPDDRMQPQTTTATTHNTQMIVVSAVLVVALAFVWAYVRRK